jgi:hypothetical protein
MQREAAAIVAALVAFIGASARAETSELIAIKRRGRVPEGGAALASCAAALKR